ncbi:hypothetical protein FQR65_LT01632 [Abscondita terminalis]|nr:hypothetical protein FQR65_LT01632 [Abscondita terminalis]
MQPKNTREETKFNHLLTVLPPAKIADEVSDLITQPDPKIPYLKLKSAIVNRTTLSNLQNLKKIALGGGTSMSGYTEQSYWDPNVPPQAQGEYNFDIPVQDFGNDLNFQSFESVPSQQYDQSLYGQNPYLNPSGGEYGQGSTYLSDSKGAYSSNEFDDEPPLLEDIKATIL